MIDPFHGARLKIERGKQHINDLQMQAQSFADANPHTFFVETDPNTGINALRIAPAQPLPEELLPVLGDALHNLRSALDHAWCKMVFKPTPYTKFPVYKTLQALEAAVNGGLKENSSEEVRDVVVDLLQPYLGGTGEMLYHLHELDIEDKHRLLIAHRQFTLVRGITLRDDRGEEFEIGDWLIVPPHTASHPIEGHRRFEITGYGHASTHVTFGEGMPLEGQFVLPTLHQFTRLVTHVINCFEALRRVDG